MTKLSVRQMLGVGVILVQMFLSCEVKGTFLDSMEDVEDYEIVYPTIIDSRHDLGDNSEEFQGKGKPGSRRKKRQQNEKPSSEINHKEEDPTKVIIKDWILELTSNQELLVSPEADVRWVSREESGRTLSTRRNSLADLQSCRLQVGSVQGSNNSVVAMTYCKKEGLTGMIMTGGESYFLHPALHFGVRSPHLLYRAKVRPDIYLHEDQDFPNASQSFSQIRVSNNIVEPLRGMITINDTTSLWSKYIHRQSFSDEDIQPKSNKISGVSLTKRETYRNTTSENQTFSRGNYLSNSKSQSYNYSTESRSSHSFFSKVEDHDEGFIPVDADRYKRESYWNRNLTQLKLLDSQLPSETSKNDDPSKASYDLRNDQDKEVFSKTQNNLYNKQVDNSRNDDMSRMRYDLDNVLEEGSAEEDPLVVIGDLRRRFQEEEEVGYFLDSMWEKENIPVRPVTSPSNPPPRWLELALVVDQSVIKFHGADRAPHYMLSLMNIVSAIYKDSSLDSNLQLVIVRMIFYTDEADGQVEEGNSKKSLENVNRWNEELLSGLRPDQRHDVAVWLTREDIGGPSGYAPVSGACDPTRSCTLNRDEGLTSAFIIAHEVAHVLGLSHDGDQSAGNSCNQEALEGSVMAPMVAATFHRFSWSYCSKTEFHTKTLQWSCLTNPPLSKNATLLNSTIESTYSMDEQCRMEFGEGYSLCRIFELPEPCSHLWCGHSATDLCKTKKGPPLEGTECGLDKWCVNGYCELVDPSRFQDPVSHNPRHGGWSPWSDWGHCSRSCGVGVKFRTRNCDNPRPEYGGDDCRGKSEEFRVCGSRACPEPLSDFRAEQCTRLSELLPTVFTNWLNYTWLPHESDVGNSKCQLTCVSKESNKVLSTGENLVDGTRCSYDGGSDICIQGDCQTLGCDGTLDSTLQEDACGVCGGNNTHCVNITTHLLKKIRRHLTRVAVLPRLARHIRVVVNTTWQEDPFRSVGLVLRDRRRSRQYTLAAPSDGNGVKDRNEVKVTTVVEGVRFHYQRQGPQEVLWGKGPLLAELVVSVVASEGAVKVGVVTAARGQYTLHDSQQGARGRYVWLEGGWGPCSRSCGGGKKLRTTACRDTHSGRLVGRGRCSLVQKPPPRTAKCNTFSCEFLWRAGNWEHCSATCGSRGTQAREVFCVHGGDNGTSTQLPPWAGMVDPVKCQQGLKPESSRPCNREPCLVYWVAGNWSQCSTTCGAGVETREYRCPAPRGEPLFDCGTSPPDERRNCRGLPHRHVDFEPLCGHTSPWPCRRDTSRYCGLTNLLGRYCVIPGFKELCCKSCNVFMNSLPE